MPTLPQGDAPERSNGIAASDVLLPKKSANHASIHLIAKRNIADNANITGEERVDAIGRIRRVALDREGLETTDGLECLGPITHLFLQHNVISRIENIECFTHLRVLTLFNNNITRVENIRGLTSLQWLDLSNNAIVDFVSEEYPPSLVFLCLRGNPCSFGDGYRETVANALPQLKSLDDEPIEGRDDVDDEGDDDDDAEDAEDAQRRDIRERIAARVRNNEGVPDTGSDRRNVTDVSKDVRQRTRLRVKELQRERALRTGKIESRRRADDSDDSDD